MSKGSENFSEREAERRFKAALRGAARVGHKPQEDMRKRKAKPKRAKRGK